MFESKQEIQLKVVVLKETDGKNSFWVVQCLDYDIAAQGKTIQEARRAFEKEFACQMLIYSVNKQNPFDMIQPAPKKYWEKYKDGAALRDPLQIRPPANIPPAWMIPLVSSSNIHVA